MDSEINVQYVFDPKMGTPLPAIPDSVYASIGDAGGTLYTLTTPDISMLVRTIVLQNSGAAATITFKDGAAGTVVGVLNAVANATTTYQIPDGWVFNKAVYAVASAGATLNVTVSGVRTVLYDKA